MSSSYQEEEKRTLESDSVLLDGVNGVGRDGRPSVNDGGHNVDLLPLNGSL